MRSADFFDVANFPLISFDGHRVVSSPESFMVVGDLTIHGQTRQCVSKIEAFFQEVGNTQQPQADL